MKTINVQTKLKRIEDLTLRELNMVYSLVRIGDWPDSEIGRVYKLSETDVREISDNYVELLGAAGKNVCGREQLRRDPSPEATKKPRKRRSDAIFATAKERQRAYRNRLKEKRNADMQMPSRDRVTAIPTAVDQVFP